MAIGQFISSGSGYEFKVITDTSGTELDLSSALTGADVPSTILITTTYFDAQFRISGNNVATYTGATEVATDGTLTGATLQKIEEVEAKTVTTYSGETVVSSVETGFIKNSSDVKVKEWTYNFDANGDITSGTETEGSLVRTLTTNWAVVSEKGSVTGLTAIDTTGIPTGAIASTGDVFKTTEGVETTYYDADGDITGYGVTSGNSTTYFDSDYEWVGDVFENSRSTEVIEVRAGANGAYSEVGSFTLKDGSYARSWTFNFDGSDSFTGGSETENGITKTYNSSWQVTSSVAELGSLTALTAAEIGELSVFGFASGDSGYKSVSGVQTTYYSDGGVIVGYSGTQTGSDSSSTLYFDEDYAWLGETRTEGTKTWTEFVTRDATAGTLTVAGSEAEGGVTLREWKYIHNESTGDLIEGYEIQNDIRIDFGANWVVTSETFTGTTTTTTDAGELALIPDALKFDASGTTTASYSEITNPWGTETVYFNGAGAVLGRSFENTGPAGETFTGFNDDDGQYLGSIFELGTRKEVRFETRDDQTLQTTETGAEYEAGSSTPVRTWTYIFDNTFNLVSGTETEGGVTKTFGANWKLTSSAVSNISALDTTTDVDLIPSSFVFDGTAYYLEKDFGHNTERTFYNPDDSSLIGYSNTFTDTVRGSVNTFFEDADREWIGDYQNNNGFEFAFFNIENDDGTYTEYGFESGDGFDRSWEIQKSSTGQIIGGYQIENGITAIFDQFGNIASKTVSVDNLQEVTTDLDDLPDSWILKKEDSSEYALRQVKSSSWGDEATYFNASGNILGVARSWSDSWNGMQTKGISFEDANFNYLGDIYIETNGDQTRKFVRFETLNESGALASNGLSFDRQETGSEYVNGSLDRSWDFKFDVYGKLVEGNETVGSITTKYGPGWSIVGTEVSAANIVTTTVSADDVRFLPTAFVESTTVGETTTYKTYTVSQDFDWGGSETIYFDDALGSNIVGYENSWVDPWRNAEGSGFEDAHRNWIGHVDNDGQYVRYNFYSVVSGVRYESGGEYKIQNGIISDTAERSFSFEFNDATGKLIEGSESFGGTTTTYGADWSIEGQTNDNFSLEDFKLTEAEEALIVFLPDEFLYEEIDGQVYTYAEEQRQSANDAFITFYDETGKALGYANLHNDANGFFIGLNDLEWNFLGNISSFENMVEVREEKLANGRIIETGGQYDYTNQTVDIDNPLRTWEYQFEPGTYNFLQGTETSAGVTTTYGRNWVVTGKSVSASNIDEYSITEFEASLLPSTFVIDLRTDDTEAHDYHIYTSTQDFTWGGSETIYFSSNVEGAQILGYENGWSWSDGGGRSESQSSFENANRVYLGDTYDNGDWITARFETSTSTTRTETGAEYQYENGVVNETPIRMWSFVFKGNTLESGSETFDGKTVVYGENWSIESSTKANFVAADLRKTATDPDNGYISLLPDQLKVVEAGVEVIYSDTVSKSWGEDETTYYNASGKVLGYGYDWNDQVSGASGGGFSTADWQPLGSYYDDGSSFAEVRTQTFNASTNRIVETGKEFAYIGADLDIANPVREFSNIYDINWNFISGEETVAGVTTKFGVGRIVESKTFDTSKINETSISSEDAKLLPDQFVIKIGSGETAVYKTFTVSSSSEGNSNTTYFDGDSATASLLGNKNTWTNNHSESGSDFNDANGNWLGNVYNNGTLVNANFHYYDTSGSYEKGGEYSVSVGGTINLTSPIREYEYIYGMDGKLDEGFRLEFGVRTEFDENFAVKSVVDANFSSKMASIKEYVATEPFLAVYDELSTNLIAGSDEKGEYVYKDVAFEGSTDQFKFYSETGSVIAYVNEHTRNDFNGNLVTEINVNGPDWEFLGRIEAHANFVRVENYSETATHRTRSATEFERDGDTIDTSSEGVIAQSERVELRNGQFVSDTQTINGVVNSYDQYGGLISTSFANLGTLPAQTVADFDYLPDSFVSAGGNVYAKTVLGNYGDSKTFFFDDAQGTTQIGISDYNQWTDPETSETYKNYYFYNANGNVGSANLSNNYENFQASYDVNDTNSGLELTVNIEIQKHKINGSWETRTIFERYYAEGPKQGVLYDGYEIEGNFRTNYGEGYELLNKEFNGTFDPAALSLNQLEAPIFTITDLPDSGVLKLNDTAVLVNDVIPFDEIQNGNLVYEPGTTIGGIHTSITATVKLGTDLSDNSAIDGAPITFDIPVGAPKPIDIFDSGLIAGLQDGDVLVIEEPLVSVSHGTVYKVTALGLEAVSVEDEIIVGEDTLLFEPLMSAVGKTVALSYSIDNPDVAEPLVLSVNLPVSLEDVVLDPRAFGEPNPLDYYPDVMINALGTANEYVLVSEPILDTFSANPRTEQSVYASADHSTFPAGSLLGRVYEQLMDNGGIKFLFMDADQKRIGEFESADTYEFATYELPSGNVVEKEIRWHDASREQVTFEREFIWTDWDRNDMVSGFKIEGGVQLTFNPDGSITSALVDASQAVLFDDPAVLSFMPASFLLNNGMEAYVIQLPNLGATPPYVEMKFYNPNVAGNPVYLGQGKLTFPDGISSATQIGMTNMTFTAEDVNGAEFGTGDLSFFQESGFGYSKYETNYEEILNGARTETASTILMNENETVIDSETLIKTYDAADPDVLVSTRLTKNGQTTITFEDNTPTINNSAPVITVTADTSAENSAGIAGEVDVSSTYNSSTNQWDKNDDPSNFFQYGSASVTDADGDSVGLTLYGSDEVDLSVGAGDDLEIIEYFGGTSTSTVTVQSMYNEFGYGELLFQSSTGKYVYVFEDPYTFYNADHADESFVLASSDTYHNVYKELEFELLNANQPAWGQFEKSAGWVPSDYGVNEYTAGKVDELSVGSVVSGTFKIEDGEIYASGGLTIGYYNKVWDSSAYGGNGGYVQGPDFTTVLTGPGVWSTPIPMEYGTLKLKINTKTPVDTEVNYKAIYTGEYEYTYNGVGGVEGFFGLDEGDIWNDSAFVYLRDGSYENQIGSTNFLIFGENNTPIVKINDQDEYRFDGATTLIVDVLEEQNNGISFNVVDKPAEVGDVPRSVILSGADAHQFIVYSAGGSQLTGTPVDAVTGNVLLGTPPAYYYMSATTPSTQIPVNAENVGYQYELNDLSLLGFKLYFKSGVNLDYDTATQKSFDLNVTYVDEHGASTSSNVQINLTDNTNEWFNTAPTSDHVTFNETLNAEGIISFSQSDFTYDDVDETGQTHPNKIEIDSLPAPVIGKLQIGGIDVTVGQIINNINDLKFVVNPTAQNLGDNTSTADFDFYVVDNAGTRSASTYTATINLTDHSPSISAPTAIGVLKDGSVDLDSAILINAFSDGDGGVQGSTPKGVIITDVSAGTLSQKNGASYQDITTFPHGVNFADLSNLKYTPVAGESGANYANISYRVFDGYSESAVYQLSINVNVTNTAPTSPTSPSIDAIVDQQVFFTTSDFPYDDADGNPMTSIVITGFTGPGTLFRGGSPLTIPAEGVTVPVADLNNNSLYYVSDTAGTASLTFKVSDGIADSSEQTMTLNASVNHAPTTTPVVKTGVDIGATIVLDETDWNFTDIDGDTLSHVRIVGGDTDFYGNMSWLSLGGSPVSTNSDVTLAELVNGDLKIETPFIPGTKTFIYKVFDEHELGSTTEQSFTISSSAYPISGLSGDEYTARIGADPSLTTYSGDLSSLIDFTNYAGGKINISGYSNVGMTFSETFNLGTDALVNSAPLINLDAGGSFKLYQDLTYDVTFAQRGGESAGETNDVFITLLKDGQDTVQGKLNLVYTAQNPALADIAPDAALNVREDETLDQGQSGHTVTGTINLLGRDIVKVIQDSDPSNTDTMYLSNSYTIPLIITGANGSSLTIQANGDYTYTYADVAHNAAIGSTNFETFTIIVDESQQNDQLYNEGPRKGTLTFEREVVEPVAGFGLVTNTSADIVIDYGNGNEDDVDLVIDGGNNKILNFSTISLQESFVEDLINGLAGNSALDVKFSLASLPTGSGTAFVELMIMDKGNGNWQPDTAERAIAMVLQVDFDNNSVTIPNQASVNVQYKGSNTDSQLNFTVENLDSDTFNVSTGLNNAPDTLNLKLGNILAKLDDTGKYSSSFLSDPGTYQVVIRAQQALDDQTSVDLPLTNSAGTTVEEVRGEIEVTATPKFTLITNDAQNADVILNAGGMGETKSIDLYIDPNDSDVLKFSRVTLNDQFVQNKINGLASNSALDLSFKLGQMPVGTGSAFIELTVQDKGNNNMSVETGERAISMVLKVDYDGNSVTLPQQNDIVVKYQGSSGGTATFMVHNLDPDTINLQTGSNSTPNTLNLKLGSILEKLDASSVYSSSLLSDPGNYIVSLTGKSALDNGSDVELPIVDSSGNSIKSIVGEVEIIDPPSNVEFHYGGSSGHVIALTTTEDPFGKVTFADFDVDDFVFTDFSLAPALKFDLNDAIDTNGGSWAEKVAVQIYYDDNDNGNLDNGEAWVEAIFEVTRSGDGSTEFISTGGTGTASDDISISYGNQINAQGPIALATITLTNDVEDIFSITEGSRAGTPGTMNVRLDAILDEFNAAGGANVPLPQVGDNLEISISLLLENENDLEILDGSISII